MTILFFYFFFSHFRTLFLSPCQCKTGYIPSFLLLSPSFPSSLSSLFLSSFFSPSLPSSFSFFLILISLLGRINEDQRSESSGPQNRWCLWYVREAEKGRRGGEERRGEEEGRRGGGEEGRGEGKKRGRGNEWQRVILINRKCERACVQSRSSHADWHRYNPLSSLSLSLLDIFFSPLFLPLLSCSSSLNIFLIKQT